MTRPMQAVAVAASLIVGLSACAGTTVGDDGAGMPASVETAPSLDARPVQEQLVQAVIRGDAAVAELALAAGADPSLYDRATDNSALSLAITRDDLAMVELLLAAGGKVEWPEYEYSELEIAGTFASADVVRALLATGADPNGVGTRKGLPLIRAAVENNAGAMGALLEAGADPNAVEDAEGAAPPLFWAAYGGSQGAALVLVDAGTDVAIRDRDGFAPSDWADSQGHRELATLLREWGA